MELRGCCASAVDAVFTFRWRNRPDVSVPVRAPAHDHVIPQLLFASESLTTARRCLRRVSDFLHPARLQPWLQAACAAECSQQSLAAISAGCEWVVSMLDVTRESILAARTALHSSEQFRLNRFDECSEWRCVDGCAVPPNMHVDIIVHNQRMLLLAWLLQPITSKSTVGDTNMYSVGTAPEDAIGMHVMYRGMMHSIASACVAAETDSPHRDNAFAGLEYLISQNLSSAGVQVLCSTLTIFLVLVVICDTMLQAGHGVQWRACSQALLAIASIKRTLLQFNTLLVYFPPQAPPAQPPMIAPSLVVPLAAAASLRRSPTAAPQPPVSHPGSREPAEAIADSSTEIPMTPVSVLCSDDACSSCRDESVVDDGGSGAGGSPAVSDDFLSQLFGEKEAKFFQPFL